MLNIGGFSSSTLMAVILLLSIINIVFLHLLLSKSKYEKKIYTTINEIAETLNDVLKMSVITSNVTPPPMTDDQMKEKLIKHIDDSDGAQLSDLLKSLDDVRNNVK